MKHPEGDIVDNAIEPEHGDVPSEHDDPSHDGDFEPTTQAVDSDESGNASVPESDVEAHGWSQEDSEHGTSGDHGEPTDSSVEAEVIEATETGDSGEFVAVAEWDDVAPGSEETEGDDTPSPTDVDEPVEVDERLEADTSPAEPEELQTTESTDSQATTEPPASESAYDDSTPLAREIAEITKRRMALQGRTLPLPPTTRIFTVANQKGGVGKTTTTVNLAAALARGGANVLVIDLDPQGNASTALGVEHRAETASVYDVIVGDAPMADIVQPSPDFEGLFCVPATIHLAGAEIELVSLVAREQRLRTALTAFLESSPEPIHYVFIDCPPSLGLLTINAFVAAREVLIPIQCEYYALEGLSQLLTNIQLIEKHLNPVLTVSTILLTMYDSRTNLANQVVDEVREHFPAQVLTTVIPRSVRISEAPSYGQTVVSYDPGSAGSLSYLEAAGEIADRGIPA